MTVVVAAWQACLALGNMAFRDDECRCEILKDSLKRHSFVTEGSFLVTASCFFLTLLVPPRSLTSTSLLLTLIKFFEVFSGGN